MISIYKKPHSATSFRTKHSILFPIHIASPSPPSRTTPEHPSYATLSNPFKTSAEI